MRNAYDLEDFTRQRLPCRNRLASVLTGLKTGSTGAIPALCLPPDRDQPRQEQVYHKLVFLAIGSRNRAARSYPIAESPLADRLLLDTVGQQKTIGYRLLAIGYAGGGAARFLRASLAGGFQLARFL